MSLRSMTILAALLVSISFLPAVVRQARCQQVGDKKVKNKPTNEERIRAALKQPCELDYLERPLCEIAEELADTYNFNVMFRMSELKAIGKDTDTPITIHVKDISLQSALTLLLDDLDLTWVIHHEVLLVTTKDEAETILVTRVYDVKDLVYRDEEEEKNAIVYSSPELYSGQVDFEQLIAVITSNVYPDSWEDNGGVGSIDGFESDDKALLVLSQTEQTHQKVAELLEMIRKAPARALPKKPAPPKAKDKEAGKVRDKAKIYAQVYPISVHAIGEPEGYAQLVREAIEPHGWDGLDGTHVSAAARTVVVRHNQTAHRKIQELLSAVGAFEEDKPTISGGNIGYSGTVQGGGFGGGGFVSPQGGGFFQVAPQK